MIKKMYLINYRICNALSFYVVIDTFNRAAVAQRVEQVD